LGVILSCASCKSPQPSEPGPKAGADKSDVSDLLDKPLYQFTEAEVDRYLHALPEIEPNLHKRIIRLGRQNIGQPYDIYLLGEFPFEDYDPDPLYCLNKSDCLVFTEHMFRWACHATGGRFSRRSNAFATAAAKWA
jgi:hypothetical protein